MLRKPSWISTAIATSVIALVAVCASEAAHAAADSCLSAPKGAAPKGQHWYYRVDRANQRKCWYLHETTAVPAGDARAPSAGTDRLARPAAPVETVRPAKRAAASPPPADASAQPSGASVVESDASYTDEATAAFAAPKPANTNTAAPLQPQSGAMPWPDPPAPASRRVREADATPGDQTAAQSGAMLWPDPPAPASRRVREADATPGGGAPVGVWNKTDPRATAKHAEVVAQHHTKPASAAAPDEPSTNSVIGNLLIIALAAALGGGVSGAFAVVLRRRPVKALAAALGAGVSAAFAVVLRRKPVKAKPDDFFPRFGSIPDRQSVGRSKVPARKARSAQSAPVQTSLIPEHLTIARPFVAPWWQERVNQDRRARLDEAGATLERHDGSRTAQAAEGDLHGLWEEDEGGQTSPPSARREKRSVSA